MTLLFISNYIVLFVSLSYIFEEWYYFIKHLIIFIKVIMRSFCKINIKIQIFTTCNYKQKQCLELLSNISFRICYHRHLFHSTKYMPPPLLYFKVNIYPFPLPHFASIFFAYLWLFRWPNYIVTLPRYFSFRLPHLNIPTGPPSDKLDKNSQRTWLIKNFSQWNGYNHFRSGLNWFRKLKKGALKIKCQ